MKCVTPYKPKKSQLKNQMAKATKKKDNHQKQQGEDKHQE